LRDLAVRQPRGGQSGDLLFLFGQLDPGCGLPALRFTGGPELLPCPFRPWTGAKRFERVACRAQRLSCCGDPASMAQPGTVFE
jgi:hypothetical protein